MGVYCVSVVDSEKKLRRVIYLIKKNYYTFYNVISEMTCYNCINYRNNPE